MSALDIKGLQATLQARRQEIMTRLQRLEAGWGELGGEREIEREEEAQKADLTMVYDQLDNLERQEIEEIDHALDKLERGSYGPCEECGENIGGERLAALPSTRWCRACAASKG